MTVCQDSQHEKDLNAMIQASANEMIGQIVQHYKGGTYVIVGAGLINTSTKGMELDKQLGLIYKPLNSYDDGFVMPFLRPVIDFLPSEDNYIAQADCYRFEFITGGL